MDQQGHGTPPPVIGVAPSVPYSAAPAAPAAPAYQQQQQQLQMSQVIEQKNDIAAAITRTDFLVDIVPREEARDEVIPRALGAPAGEPLAYYYVQQ